MRYSERIIAIIQMIRSANSLITCLQKDLEAYNAGSMKVRAMLSKSWIERNLVKYTGIRERLIAWYTDIIERGGIKQAIAVLKSIFGTLYLQRLRNGLIKLEIAFVY